jgi:hypothetical protein
MLPFIYGFGTQKLGHVDSDSFLSFPFSSLLFSSSHFFHTQTFPVLDYYKKKDLWHPTPTHGTATSSGRACPPLVGSF